MSILFRNYSRQVNRRIKDCGVSFLEEASSEIESQTKRNTKVKTGRTKGSWEHIVDTTKLEAQVGSRYKNAVWEEFGTGIYALNGDGRNTPWVYKSDEDGKWHRTRGKKPRRAFWNAYLSLKNRIIAECERRFREL